MHEGHRKRFTAKLTDGFTFYDHEILEIILYNACPRKDLNEVAHRLVDSFGSVAGVLSASVDDLTKIEGIGKNIAEYIRVLGMCIERCDGSTGFGVVKNTDDFLRLYSARTHKEGKPLEIYVLDKDDRVRRIGGFGSDGKYEGDVIALLTSSRAYGVFAALMRDGNCFPVEADREILKSLARICRSCAVRLYDFCVSGGDGIYSCFIHGELSGDRL